MEADGEPAVPLLLDELVRAPVPDLDAAGTILPGRDLTLEIGVLQGVILDVDGECALAGLERDTFGHCPAGKRAVALEAEVVVEPPGVVALDDEDRFSSTLLRARIGFPARR
jgi:hypothetical protein